MELDKLLQDIPNISDINAFADWVCKVAELAKTLNNKKIAELAEKAEFFLSYEGRRKEYLAKITSQLKLLQRNSCCPLPSQDRVFHDACPQMNFNCQEGFSDMNMNLHINNINTNSLSFGMDIVSVRNEISKMDSISESERKVALEKVAEIETLLSDTSSHESRWKKAVPILKWISEKGYDIAKTILPILLQAVIR